MEITKEIQIDYGHLVHLHDSHCFHPHGHRARIVAHLEGKLVGEEVSEKGMVMDFKHIKTILMNKIHNVLDHSFIIAKDAPQRQHFETLNALVYNGTMRLVVLDSVPTAENLAFWCFKAIENDIVDQYQTGLKLTAVEFWETPSSCALYSE